MQVISSVIPHCSRIKFQHQVPREAEKKMSTCYLDNDTFRFGCDTCFHSNYFAEGKSYEKN